MSDIQRVIADHNFKDSNKKESEVQENMPVPRIAEIPCLFFDEIMTSFKLARHDIIVLMYLYRRVWCAPNLFKIHGISPLMSHQLMADETSLSINNIYDSLSKLESFGFLSTIRSGQYFVRRYFTKENDEKFSQFYDDFES